MSEDSKQTNGQEPREPENQEAPGAQSNGGEGQEPEPKTYDADYVRKLRAEAAKYRKERNEFEKRLKELEEAEKQRERAKLDEVERLKLERDEALARAQEAMTISQRRLMRSAVIAEAAKMGFLDPTDAWRMIDENEITINDEGDVVGADKAIKALAKAKPYLLKKSESHDINANDGRGKGRGRQADQKARIEELRRRFRI